MKALKVSLSFVLSATLLLTGCGGGGGGSSSGGGSEAIQGSKVTLDKVPSNTIQRRDLYNKRMIEYAEQTNDIYTTFHKTFGQISNNFTKDLNQMDAQDSKVLFDGINKIDAMANDNLLLAYNAINLLYPNSNSRSTKPTLENRAVVLGTFVLVAGIATTLIGTVGQKAVDANNARNAITADVLLNLSSRDTKAFNREYGFPENTLSSELVSKFYKMGWREKNVFSTKVRSFALIAEDLDPDYLTKYKRGDVKSAVELGKAGVESTAGLYATAIGGQGVDKVGAWMGKNVGMSAETAKNFGTIVDTAATYVGVQPLDVVKKMVVAKETKKKRKKVIPPSSMSSDEAIKVLKGGSSSAKDIENAKNKLQQEMALKTGTGTKKKDGSVEVDLAETVSIQTAKNVKEGTIIKVPKAQGKENVLIVAEKMAPKVIEDVVLTGGELLDVGMKTLEEIFAPKDSSFSVSKAVSTKERDSITYTVTATLKGITKPTSIKIDVTNASTSSSTKTLNKDGSVSWKVTVLEKDATVALTRLDTKITKSLSLEGVGELYKYLDADLKSNEKCDGREDPFDVTYEGDRFVITDSGKLMGSGMFAIRLGTSQDDVFGSVDKKNNKVSFLFKTDRGGSCSGGGTIQSGSITCIVPNCELMDFTYYNGRLSY